MVASESDNGAGEDLQRQAGFGLISEILDGPAIGQGEQPQSGTARDWRTARPVLRWRVAGGRFGRILVLAAFRRRMAAVP